MPFTWQVRYRQHTDAPRSFRRAYKRLFHQVTVEHNYTPLLEAWSRQLTAKELGRAKDRELLNRHEGGLGGNSNTKDRQIRLCHARNPSCEYHEFVLEFIPSDDGTEVWPFELVQAFGECLHDLLQRVGGGIDYYVVALNKF